MYAAHSTGSRSPARLPPAVVFPPSPECVAPCGGSRTGVARVHGMRHSLPVVGRVLPVLDEPRHERIHHAGPLQDVIHGSDHIEDGAGFELACQPLRLVPDVVRSGAGVDHRVVPQTGLMGASVAQIHKGSDSKGEAGPGDPKTTGNVVGHQSEGTALQHLGQSAEGERLNRCPDRELLFEQAIAKLAVAQDVALRAPVDVSTTCLGRESWPVNP